MTLTGSPTCGDIVGSLVNVLARYQQNYKVYKLKSLIMGHDMDYSGPADSLALEDAPEYPETDNVGYAPPTPQASDTEFADPPTEI